MITTDDINLLSKVSRDCGFKVNPKDLKLIFWNKGIDTHKPTKLPEGYFAVYIFQHNKNYLKVGKVSGSKNNDRYYQHHYIVKGANSTLAKSLSLDPIYSKKIIKGNEREWILKNTSRFNILIPKSYEANFVNFAEAFFILRCNPKFEGKK